MRFYRHPFRIRLMSIYDEVLSFIKAPEPTGFEALALKVFRHQFDVVAPYRAFCLSRGARPGSIASLDEVPALSTAAFKYAFLSDPVTTREEYVFMTSGTTAGRDERGHHRVPYPGIYKASAVAHVHRMLFPDEARMRMLSLHPTADRMPESSLGRMIGWIMEEFGQGDGLCVADRERVDIPSALAFLRASELRGEPVCLMGTTASCAALFDGMRAGRMRFDLAQGSRLMDTGGAKGQAVALDSGQVVEYAREFLGLDAALVINEYGMTEMCSQLYDATAFNSDSEGSPKARRKVGPAWLGVAAVDPVSLKPVARGKPGLLRFFDLANVGSVSAILTGDLGVVEEGTVRVLGRAEDGEDRGCALGIEQFARRGIR